jgi:hypothetical protein
METQIFKTKQIFVSMHGWTGIKGPFIGVELFAVLQGGCSSHNELSAIKPAALNCFCQNVPAF